MADIIEIIQPDNNHNTDVSSSEQSDVVKNETGDSDEHRLSLTSDNNLASDEIDGSTPNPYKDFTGIDTESFITNSLRNNPKDRVLLLTLEKVFQEFIQNKEQQSYQFQAMNSYERMIVHRVAAFFGLDHNVDKNGQSIIVTKTANTRIPNFSFENFIPTDELPNGATIAVNPSNENSTRRTTHRNNKPSATNQYVETRDKLPNKFNRKQRFNTNHHVQQTNFQPANQYINARAQSIYPSASNSYYPQHDHDYKQQTTASPMYNYVPMVSQASYQQGNGIPLPILFHQQPNGQIQYVIPSHSLQQQQQQQPPTPISSDGQYMPVYRSDVMPENNLYSQTPYVHLYPTHSYPHTQPQTYIQPAPSFMNPTSIQYATNQLAALNIQSQYEDSRFIQSKSFASNGLNQHSNYHQPQYRQIRPLNPNHTDKQLPPIENDVKSTDQISLSGPTQEKD